MKQSFEGIKDVLKKIEENRQYQNDIVDLKKQLSQKEQKSLTEEINIKEAHDLKQDQFKNRHKEDLAALQQEEGQVRNDMEDLS